MALQQRFVFALITSAIACVAFASMYLINSGLSALEANFVGHLSKFLVFGGLTFLSGLLIAPLSGGQGRKGWGLTFVGSILHTALLGLLLAITVLLFNYITNNQTYQYGDPRQIGEAIGLLLVGPILFPLAAMFVPPYLVCWWLGFVAVHLILRRLKDDQKSRKK